MKTKINRSDNIKNMPELLTVKQAAEYSGLHRNTIYKNHKNGVYDGLSLKFGGTIFILKKAFKPTTLINQEF